VLASASIVMVSPGAPPTLVSDRDSFLPLLDPVHLLLGGQIHGRRRAFSPLAPAASASVVRRAAPSRTLRALGAMPRSLPPRPGVRTLSPLCSCSGARAWDSSL
jgi:hypothetical protein